jgi:hypothetical protein
MRDIPTYIQTGAAVIQALAAGFFLWGVRLDTKRRAQFAEQEGRDQIINALHFEWTQTALASDEPPKSPAEIGGIHTPRKIAFFNSRLKELGYSWTYPFPRVGA